MNKKVLFICLGNICRSPAAEEIFRVAALRAGLAVEADSAGLIDFHEGELADPRMRACAAKRGYELRHRSRPVRASDFDKFDLIVAMDGQNVRALRRLAPTETAEGKVVEAATFLQHHVAASVPDPYYGTEKDFEHVVSLLEDMAEGLVARLRDI